MRIKIEMPRGTRLKYEYKNGVMEIDRILPISVPHNYGFLPESDIQADGDLADVFLVSEESIPPGVEAEVDILGVITCMDNGVRDDKYVATFKGNLLNGKDIHDIVNYLSNYKQGFYILNVDISLDKYYPISDSNNIF